MHGMTTATETVPTRILPSGLYSEHAFAFGYIRGSLQSLFEIANSAYYSDPEDRILELENQIHRVESTLKQLESEMYPNA